MVMNRTALKWKLMALLAGTLVGAAAGLVTIGLSYLLEIAIGSKSAAGENWVIFLSFLFFGLISGLVGAAKLRPRMWD